MISVKTWLFLFHRCVHRHSHTQPMAGFNNGNRCDATVNSHADYASQSSKYTTKAFVTISCFSPKHVHSSVRYDVGRGFIFFT